MGLPQESATAHPVGALLSRIDAERFLNMPVKESRDGHILTIQLDRPERRNAVDESITVGIDAALNRLDDDPGLWVGVLTGTSTVFSAGTDLEQGSGEPTPRGGEYGLMRRRRRKPLVAAVEGWAAGGASNWPLPATSSSRRRQQGSPCPRLGEA